MCVIPFLLFYSSHYNELLPPASSGLYILYILSLLPSCPLFGPSDNIHSFRWCWNVNLGWVQPTPSWSSVSTAAGALILVAWRNTARSVPSSPPRALDVGSMTPPSTGLKALYWLATWSDQWCDAPRDLRVCHSFVFCIEQTDIQWLENHLLPKWGLLPWNLWGFQ